MTAEALAIPPQFNAAPVPAVDAARGPAPARPDAAPDGGDWRVVGRDAHSTVWERAITNRNAVTGRAAAAARRIVQLQSGLNYRAARGAWQPTRPEFVVQPDGSAAVLTGPIKAAMPATLGGDGVRLVLPDGSDVRWQVLGVGWFDPVNGRSVLLGEAVDVPGELVASNRVVYRRAFRGTAASVEYVYAPGGFSQHVILEEAPPPPEDFGLSEQSRLEVYTELVSASQAPAVTTRVLRREVDAVVRAALAEPDLNDATLAWGATRMIRGRAFLSGQAPADARSSAPVAKQLEVIEGRKILIEGCEMGRIRPLLESLPRREARAPVTAPVQTAQLRRVPLERLYAAHAPRPAPPGDEVEGSAGLQSGFTSLPNLSRVDSAPRGFVIDYELADTATDYRFHSDTNYWVTGPVYLSGTTRVEGGAVFKYQSAAYQPFLMQLYGQIVCATAPYRPAIFTSMNDDSIGEVLPGSTGQPAVEPYPDPWYRFYLDLEGLDQPADLKYLQFRYAQTAVSFNFNTTVSTLRRAQFVHCQFPVYADSSDFHVRNALFYDAATAIVGQGYAGTGEHLTVHQADQLAGELWYPASLKVTNSLLVRVTSLGYTSVTTSDTQSSTDDAVFQVVGAGAHYLAASSSYRNAGTANIDPQLRDELGLKTTYAPTVIASGYLAADTTLNPTVPRDNDAAPDLGYHYESIDHVMGGVILQNVRLTLNPGSVTGVLMPGANSYGVALWEGAVLEGAGDPRNPARLVFCNQAQEQANAAGVAQGPAICYGWNEFNQRPSATLRFTECFIGQQEFLRFYYEDALTLRDCAIRGGQVSTFAIGASQFINCWWDRAHAEIGLAGWTQPFNVRNCLFTGGVLDFIYCGTLLELRDSVFDRTQLIQDGDLASSHNAYVSGEDRLTPEQATDKMVASFGFEEGTLGTHYLPAGSPLIDAGSRSVGEAGLYHYTTATAQTKDTAAVDIGLHYVALDEEEEPADSDEDGLTDYFEDINGNGTYGSGDLSDFTNNDSDGDGLPDGYERSATHTSPTLADTGATGTTDGYKDLDGDGLTNLEEMSLGKNPLVPDVAGPVFNPVGGSYASAQNVTVTCPTAGATIRYTLNGPTPTEADPVIPSPLNITSDTILKAKAWKTGWTASDTESQTYHIPGSANEPPTLTVSPPSGTQISASDDFEFLIEASDPDGTITKVQFYRGSYKLAETAASLLRYRLPKVPTGTYTFTARATDDDGAVTVVENITLIVNAPGPVVALVGVQPFFTSSPGALVARITGVKPGALSSLTLNGSPLVPRAGEFNLTVALVEGENTFTLVATDDQSRSGQATTKVYLDSVPPVIAITAPANNSSFNTDRINVQGTYTETSLKRITVNGVAAFVNGGTFEALNIPLADGPNTITATAEDIAGNQTTASINVTGMLNPVDPVQLTATPVGGFAPLEVTFSVENHAPGTVEQVLYDFNGDNVIDRTETSLTSIPHTYTTAGQYFPVVTIQTTAGRFSSPGGWSDPDPARLRINVQAPPVQVSVINVTDPVDLKWMSGDNLYVLSRSTATLIEYDSGGTVVRSLNGIGSTPTGLDVDSSGNVYVALSGENRVARFSPNGGSFQLDTSFNGSGYIGSAGSGDGQFNTPFDVAVSPDGQEIAVSDSGNHRIQVFTSSGVFVTAFGEFGGDLGQLNTPKGLTFDRIGILYVVDSGNNRISLAQTFGLIGTSGGPGTALGEFQSAINLGVGSRGLYVADTGNNRIQKLDPAGHGEGASLTPLNPRLALSSELGLSQPNAVSAVENLLDERIAIADTGHNRVLLVRLPNSPSNDPVTVWTAMTQRLLAGDIAGAIPYFSSLSADKYRAAFHSIGTTALTADITEIGALTPVFIDSETAQYRFAQVMGGFPITFLVDFVLENGTWKIMEF